MSKVLGKQTNIVPSVLGPVAVTTEYIIEYDIEDIVRTKAESQARIIQMINVGREIKPGSEDSDSISSVYTNITEDLED